MIDLHNHILHDWDDGPQTLDKALEMARQAAAIGTTIMAATPHRYAFGRQSTKDAVRDRVQQLNQTLADERINLNIIPGVEIPIDFGIVEELKSGRLSTLGDGNYVLVEPPFPNLPNNLLAALAELINGGYGIILAHPERNAVIQRSYMQTGDLSFVAACAELGCVIQLTSGSIVGRFGYSALATCRAIAQRGWKTIIASDSHDPKDRTPGYLAEARDMVGDWINSAASAKAMVVDLPAEILGLIGELL